MLNQLQRSSWPAQEDDDFAVNVCEGLSRPRKSLPCRFFYDAIGSALFEQITHQPEYYPTRTEIAILKSNARQMLDGCLSDTLLVEFGSGSSLKTEFLIEELPRLHAYVPIDVSQSALAEAESRLANRFPGLVVQPLLGDFSHPIALPPDFIKHPKIGFFPGSTIGNFTPMEAVELLRLIRIILSPGGRLIIGVDLKKDVRRLLRAYDDAEGLTAAFNLNLLSRINRELGGSFDLRKFRHEASYDPIEGRIEMHLVSMTDQNVTVAERQFRFRAGETIHTENSYKYTSDQFREIGRLAGWMAQRVWIDEEALFSVHELVEP
ncbi:MAG TPA: L-histidine N(alpha)-methyltransferase [Methylocella sp.]|nr:L-histidine N(alpha)-methyltransferase [Methylocella sp.]